MWIMFLVVMGMPSDTRISSYRDTISITTTEFSSKDSCIQAVEFSKKRKKVEDAWCVKK